MNIEPDDDQRMLFEAVDGLLARSYQPGFRGKSVRSDRGYSDEVWSALTEMGLTGLTIPEEFDGMGAGLGEVYVAMEALGKHAAVEPLLDGVYLPSWLIADLDTGDSRAGLLRRLAGGQEIFAVAHAEPRRVWHATPSVTAAENADGAIVLAGVKSPVPRAAQAALLLVTAVDADGRTGVYAVDTDAPGIVRIDGRGPDWTHASEVRFTGTPARRLGSTGEESVTALRAAYSRARLAVAAEAIGLAEAGLAQVVGYLTNRRQFGVSLDTFQALDFRCADLYAEVELARSFVLWAFTVATTGAVDPAAADDAFVYAGTMARTAAEEMIQLHGGIGMTFETDVAHLAARLTAIRESYGGVPAARRRALRTAGLTTVPEALPG
ncbi:acyl-CoA dehydrogenase family protein [Nocardia aurantia]|uniref:Acyl-CoA dehydrogenase n=1 Tax=Nocardia aurantia TaxID=2585199 RepID=A0A7K0E095_9NOCA|nr:acyl-CoA dehydrogenase family protein [Nocardia aurantia]MQY31493.1 Acyl-CoA dehydrogenase [Nocardia aurantia]